MAESRNIRKSDRRIVNILLEKFEEIADVK
jgi:hypothetical protein